MYSGLRVSACIPARDEAATVGGVIESIKASGRVSEIIVIDHGSSDQTAKAARDAGAAVHEADRIMPSFGGAEGKGDVLWRSLAVARGDVVLWVDADLGHFESAHVEKLTLPFSDPSVQMVRSSYTRSLNGAVGEGGRVTELTAKPLLQQLRPELAHIGQPLAGEYAVRASAVRTLCFEVDYGVEAGLLIDTADAFGVASIRQVELGQRKHRNRPLSLLHAQAVEVSRAILCRCGHPELAREHRPALAGLTASATQTAGTP